ncbi:MAG: efflux RND transporter periplasmic adaptor subunit [Chloroflexi bacterium]|nr:efflux RND transporter periplasmic adaptor subunit [Chloroflexota bacterium]
MKRHLMSARSRIIGALLIFAALFGGGAWWLRAGQTATPAAVDYTLVTPQRTTLTATVNAAGRLEPVRVTSLAFAAAGRVVEVLAGQGDTVAAGAILARLDDREAQLRIAQAEAGLAQARAGLDRLRGGPSQADVDAARAQVAQAEASLTQVRGSVTSADLRAAAEQVRQAELRLERILGTPATGDVATADVRVREATVSLEQQRSQLSAAKSAAATQLDQAVSSLTQAQARYATALANWQHVEAKGTDPLVPSMADPTSPGGTRPNRLSAGQQRQYRDALTQAEAGLRSAEETVAQAQVQFDNARTAEATGVTLAEGQLQVAQEQRSQLFLPADGDQVAAARAQLETARAQLERLRGEQRDGALGGALAGLEAARANLARVTADPHPADVAQAEAQVRSAEAQLASAQLARDESSLRAPHAGVIATMALRVGEAPPVGVPAVVLADLSQFIVDVAVDEIDVPRIALDQPVTLSIDALPGASLAGRVTAIAPLATAGTAVASYAVRITVSQADQRVRGGMSVGADIVVAQVDDALVVPRRAVTADRDQFVVEVVSDAALCQASADQLPARVARESRTVTPGLRNEQAIAIIDGIGEQDCIYVAGVDQRLSLFGGPPPGVRR